MNKAMPLIIAVFLGETLTAGVLYVSPGGKPQWSGNVDAPTPTGKDGPLPSLTAARDKIRLQRRQGLNEPMTVILRGGTYRQTEPFTLTPEDSNTSYIAFPGERPIISGGRVITGWTHSAGNLMVARAPGSFRELFVGNVRATRNRLPVNGFYRIDGPSSKAKPFTLKFRSGEMDDAWQGRGVEAVVLLLWTEIRMRIQKIDQSGRTATLSDTPSPNTKEQDARYWLDNVPGPPRAEGFWYHDETSGELTYWPPQDNLDGEEAVVPTLLTLVKIAGTPETRAFVTNVTFQGLTFRHTDWTPPTSAMEYSNAALEAPTAFRVTGAQNLKIDHCTFSQIGGYAIWLSRGVTDSTVSYSEIFDAGAGGVKIGERANPASLEDQTRGNIIADNEIHDVGLVYPSAVGIWIGQSSGNEISHNHVHDLPYTGIWSGMTFDYGPNQCNNNRIEYNHVHDIGKHILSDMGGIYTLGEQEGTVIRNNLVHDVDAFLYGGWGIYLDEGSTGVLVENNIVYRTSNASFHLHFGRNNVLSNNILAFGGEYQIMRAKPEEHTSLTLRRNIVYYSTGRLMVGRASWAPNVPGRNWDGILSDNNLFWDTRGAPTFDGQTFDQWRAAGRDAHSLVADPLFANAESFDFRLQHGSPASKIGFEPIDMSTVGPRGPAGAAAGTHLGNGK